MIQCTWTHVYIYMIHTPERGTYYTHIFLTRDVKCIIINSGKTPHSI